MPVPPCPQLCPAIRTDDFQQEGPTRASSLANPNMLRILSRVPLPAGMRVRIQFLCLMVAAQGAAVFLEDLFVCTYSKEILWCFMNFSSWLGASMNPRPLVQHHDHLLNPFSLRSCMLFLHTPASLLPQLEAALLESTWTPPLLRRHCDYPGAKEYSLYPETSFTS